MAKGVLGDSKGTNSKRSTNDIPVPFVPSPFKLHFCLWKTVVMFCFSVLLLLKLEKYYLEWAIALEASSVIVLYKCK